MKKQQYSDQSTLPFDLAFEIVSSLEATDVCSLGSCSKFWKQICDSDCLWESFCKQRWPSSLLAILDDDQQQDSSPEKSHFSTHFYKDSHFNLNKGIWKEIYLKKHTEMAEKMGSYRKSWSTSESCVVDIDDYLKVIEDMKAMEFGFNDVNIFFFKPNKANVLLNLAGLHYCIKHLNLQFEDVLEAITLNNIEEKQVCIQWRRKGGWTHRFPLPDQIHRRRLSLKEIIKGNEALDVLDRGLTAVVVQIQISSAIPECSTVGGGGGGGCEFTYVLPYWESTPQIQAYIV